MHMGNNMISRPGLLQRILCVVLSTALAACAASRADVIKGGYRLDNATICRNFIEDRALVEKYAGDNPEQKDEVSGTTEIGDDRDYALALARHMRVRGLSQSSCNQIVQDENSRIAAGVALGILAVGAAAANNYNNSYSPSYYGGDSGSYAWDQFYGANGTLQWRCRNRSNGQFAADFNCAGMPKIDSTWPTK